MEAAKVIKQLINNSLSGLHTAFLAKIVTYSDGYATVQPLYMIRDATGNNVKSSVVSNIPVISSARYKTVIGSDSTLKAEPLNVGDIVLCVACEKDITEAKQGSYDAPSLMNFDISSSVVVGVL
ncbi:MAG: hypothetical protein NC110_05285 [Ruminococcus sp.]|nr:hypothetical protein [Ruminococcus sp.]